MLYIQERLASLEDDFLSVLTKGEDAILSFEQRWQSLFDDIELASETTGLDPNTLALAHVTAVRCATLADISIETFSTCETIGFELMNELDGMMSNLSISDSDRTTTHLIPQRHPSTLSSSSFSSSRTLSCSPSYTPAFLHTKSTKSPCRKRLRDGDEMSQDYQCHSYKRPRFAPTSSHYQPSSATYTTTKSSPALSASPSLLPDAVTHIKRKRRVSDTDLTSSSSPSKRQHIGPRLHAVSDSWSVHHSTTSYAPSLEPLELLRLPLGRTQSAIPIESNDGLDVHPLVPSVQLPVFDTEFQDAGSIETSILPELDLDAFLRSLLEPIAPSDSLPISPLHLDLGNISDFAPSIGPDSVPSHHMTVSSSESSSSTPSTPSTTSLPMTPSSENHPDLDAMSTKPIFLPNSPSLSDTPFGDWWNDTDTAVTSSLLRLVHAHVLQPCTTMSHNCVALGPFTEV